MKKMVSALLCAFLTTTAFAASQEEVVELNLNGVEHIFTLDDLADGEKRMLKNGEHTLVIERNGDNLNVTHDGVQVDAQENLWIQEDGDTITLDSDDAKFIFIEDTNGDTQKVEVDVFVDEMPEGITTDGMQKIRIERKIEAECVSDCEGDGEHQVKVFVKKIETQE